ncbi:MAG: sulfotransferase [Flavobacteriales bacterium]|nr:sulfotransferase [Flavobacteriales bacterium]
MNKNLKEERTLRNKNANQNLSFEALMAKMNELLSQKSFTPENVDVKRLSPLVFFCYAPRSGSTLLAQTLTRTQSFSYISNFTARFWEAPYLALQLEKQLAIRDTGLRSGEVERSKYGVTAGLSEPHEFGFFWNKLLTSDDNHWIDSSKLDPDRISEFVETVNGLRSVFDKPFFFKNGIAGYNARFMRQLFPDAKFVIIDRDPLYILQSIYMARKELYNDPKMWWSIRTKDVKEIIEQSGNEFDEIALQIKSVYSEIEDALDGNDDNVLHVTYEDFCSAPNQVISNILNLCSIQPNGALITKIPKFIESSNERKVDTSTFEQMKSSILKFKSSEL